jgi:hypothetical protein
MMIGAVGRLLGQLIETDRLPGPMRIKQELFKFDHKLKAARDVTPSLSHLQMPSLFSFIGFLPRQFFRLGCSRDSRCYVIAKLLENGPAPSSASNRLE